MFVTCQRKHNHETFLDHFWTIFGACWALCKQRRIDLITPFSLDVDLWRHVEHLLLRLAELWLFRFPLHVHKHSSWLFEWFHAPGKNRSVRVNYFELCFFRMLSNAVFSGKPIPWRSLTQLWFFKHRHTQLIVCEIRINHNITQKKMHLAVAKTRNRLKTFISLWPRATWCNCYMKNPSPKKSNLSG